MPHIYMRLVATQDEANDVMSAIHSLDCVERVEEIADLMSGMEDDSSSAGLPDDAGPGIHNVEVELPHLSKSELVRQVAEEAAMRHAVTVEFVDEL
jgi:hypothetical protein